jgi:hypothetical protein
MGELTAPLPVLEATVTRRALDLGLSYPARAGEIRIPVSEREKFWPGRPVQVDRRPGRVTGVSGLAEGGLLAVWVAPAGSTVTLPEPAPPALCVPRAAVQADSVYVIEDVARVRTARRRRVSLGRSDASYTQVLSGVREGEVVVAQAEPGLRDGTVVTPGTWGTGAYRKVLVPE